MSEGGNDKLSIGEIIWAAARWLVERELLLRLGMVAFFVVAGGAAVVYAQDAGVKLLAPLDARVTALEKNQLEMQRMTIETNATLKLVAQRLGVTPITLAPEVKDGGP